MLSNCKNCGKLYKKVSREICDLCAAMEHKELDIIVNFIKKHLIEDLSLKLISDGTGVDVGTLENYLRDGKLAHTGAKIKSNCKICGSEMSGITMKGFFCSTCSSKIQSEYGIEGDDPNLRKPPDISEIKLKTFYKNVFHAQLAEDEKNRQTRYGFKKER